MSLEDLDMTIKVAVDGGKLPEGVGFLPLETVNYRTSGSNQSLH